MKIGMIFECGAKGADKKVCEQLVRMIDKQIEIVSTTLDNKPKLVAGCGQAAANLLAEGCERVVIIWDLYPAWREKGQKPCLKEDREAIFSSLKQAGVTCPPAHLHILKTFPLVHMPYKVAVQNAYRDVERGLFP